MQTSHSKRLALGAVLLAGCASGPPEPKEREVGVATRIELLDAHRVRYEAQEVPIETFLYEMRTRVRAAAGKPEQLPIVTILAPVDAAPAAMQALDRLVRQLHVAGVHRVNLGGS